MYKLLVLDIDGTLVNSRNEVTDKTKEYIKKASEKGVKVIIASGRTPYGIYEIAKEIELEKIGGYILALNGATCIDYKNNKVVFETTLDKEIVEAIYDYSIEKDVDLITFNKDVIYTPNETSKYIKFIADRNNLNIHKTENFKEELTFNIPKVLFLDEPEKIKGLEKETIERFSNLSIFRSELYLLEFCPNEIHKGNGIKKLIEMLGIKKEEVIAVGDGYNDLTMIEFAGLGVAMGNGQEELKKIADYVTKSNDDDGICHVIEKFILNQN
ncbi:MAG: Cof-type HAD-IIB family hydrolase [Lachnospirales bacterium]